MSRKTSAFYNKKEEYVIYVLLSPTKKEFYINHCRKASIRETYRHNIKSRRYATEKFINDIYPNRPCLFVLEEANATVSDIYKYKLVWLKIFLTNGFESYNYQKMLDSTRELHIKTKKLYEERKDIDLKNILSCENCFVQTYKHTLCPLKNNDFRNWF